MMIFIKHIFLFAENNFIFEFVIRYFIALFIVIMNFLFYIILTRNNLNESIYLLKKFQIKSIMNLKIDECYHLNNFEKIYKLIFKLFK